ncbi:MAG TPA: hypothetical protein EYH34_02735 [Planctomycetes bacterium]|nr:hypothetical protein [Planctomycetota bacterium]
MSEKKTGKMTRREALAASMAAAGLAAANGVLYVATWRHLYAIQGSEKNPKARIGHSGLSRREKEGP